jgi:hypothetical protein
MTAMVGDPRRVRRRPGGPGLALLSALLFGISAPLSKLLLVDMPAQMVAGLLYLGSGVGLLGVWLVRRRAWQRERPLSRGDAPWLAGAIGAGGIMAPLLFMIGLVRTPAAARASGLVRLQGALRSADRDRDGHDCGWWCGSRLDRGNLR